jgi:hypothetical protein
MNFEELFELINPNFWWNDYEGLWFCSGCSRQMDKPEFDSHYPVNCSLDKMKSHRRIRASVIEDNLKLYSKYLKSIGVKIILDSQTAEKSENELEEFPLSWYQNQLENYRKLLRFSFPVNL